MFSATPLRTVPTSRPKGVKLVGAHDLVRHLVYRYVAGGNAVRNRRMWPHLGETKCSCSPPQECVGLPPFSLLTDVPKGQSAKHEPSIWMTPKQKQDMGRGSSRYPPFQLGPKAILVSL